jgi:ribulose-phosphate 3-epimerase
MANAIKIAPSLLSADFSCLGREIASVEQAGADELHVDVMDGHFVPNITIGPVVVKDIRKCTKLPLDVHLMIEQPRTYIEAFVQAGASAITVHCETVEPEEFAGIARDLKTQGLKAGVSLNPATALERVLPFLQDADFVLAMTVNPGFGGQRFIADVVPKIRQLRARYERDIAVDGGITNETAPLVISAGATVLVAGSYIFGAADRRKAIDSLRKLT